jgi:hypothetical protein
MPYLLGSLPDFRFSGAFDDAGGGFPKRERLAGGNTSRLAGSEAVCGFKMSHPKL